MKTLITIFTLLTLLSSPAWSVLLPPENDPFIPMRETTAGLSESYMSPQACIVCENHRTNAGGSIEDIKLTNYHFNQIYGGKNGNAGSAESLKEN